MNESQLAKQWIKRLKTDLVQAGAKPVIFRHVTMYSSGIPDYSVTVGPVTVWLEFKKWPRGKISSRQQAVLNRLPYGFVVFVGHLELEKVQLSTILPILLTGMVRPTEQESPGL